MLRLASKDLNYWFDSKNRRPLIIRGARQVGKSTLVRILAKERNLDLIELNLERHTYLNRAFESLDVTTIITAIEDAVGRSIGLESLLFLDEIQATPAALAALRYFFEDMPKLAVVAAGSLLELLLPETEYSTPVGRIDYFHLGPCSFTEFLLNSGEEHAVQRLAAYRLNAEWSEALHRRLNDLLGKFLLVGGMPEAMASYLADPFDSRAWRQAQQRIVDTYQDDFAKYRKRGDWVPILQQIYRRMPAELGRKIKYTELAPGERVEKIHKAMDLLAAARIITRAMNVSPPHPPLSAQASTNVYKCYWLDIGLVSRQLRRTDLAGSLGISAAFKGVLAEQFVAQCLAYAEAPTLGPSLYYWLREGKSDNAEVDFVAEFASDEGSFALPIEVKSGAAARILSLRQYVEKFAPAFAIRLHSEAPVTELIGTTTLHSLPLYMAPFLSQIVKSPR